MEVRLISGRAPLNPTFPVVPTFQSPDVALLQMSAHAALLLWFRTDCYCRTLHYAEELTSIVADSKLRKKNVCSCVNSLPGKATEGMRGQISDYFQSDSGRHMIDSEFTAVLTIACGRQFVQVDAGCSSIR